VDPVPDPLLLRNDVIDFRNIWNFYSSNVFLVNVEQHGGSTKIFI
jgi:hypothetical protein